MNRKLYTNEKLGIAFYVHQIVEEMACEVYGLKGDEGQMYTRKNVVQSRRYVAADGVELRPMTEERPWPKYLMRSNSTRPGSWDAVCCIDWDSE